MCFVFKSAPIFRHEAPSASFDASARTTGILMRRPDLTAIVTLVSVTAFAIFAAVFPVHGMTTIASARCFGPIGSAPAIVWMISRPQSSSMRRRKLSAVPKRVSVL